jgi:hypothetical protein
VAIWINGFWWAWQLRQGWETDGRRIAWAEAVGFLLLAQAVSALDGVRGLLRLYPQHTTKHYYYNVLSVARVAVSAAMTMIR